MDDKVIPCDPKYHEEWVRNNACAQERSRRDDRSQGFDRSRNFERKRKNMSVKRPKSVLEVLEGVN